MDEPTSWPRRALDRLRQRDTAWRLGALAGAGVLLGVAALRRRSRPVATTAAAAAAPLLWRAAFGRWPLPRLWRRREQDPPQVNPS
ncbi:MAG TPA: hypothetical protein VGV61_08835 [Thermoanaerobaculia bacterium]|jgi:hypothetical protein|nr:hypothetical protein [Thermoanaerobaculia bacterium]